MNKKGDLMETLVKIILILLVGGILLFVVVEVKNWLSKTVEVEKCRISVLAAANLRVGPNEFIDKISCNPSTLEFTAKGSKRLQGNEKEIVKYEDDSIEKVWEGTVRGIADEMYTCWYQFGQGKVNPFPSNELKGEAYCFVCSQMSFTPQLAEKFEGQIDYAFFKAFIDTNKISSASETTYADYFSYSWYEDILLSGYLVTKKNEEEMETASIDLTQHYALVFVYSSPTLYAKISPYIYGGNNGATMAAGGILTVPLSLYLYDHSEDYRNMLLENANPTAVMYLTPLTDINAIGCTQMPY